MGDKGCSGGCISLPLGGVVDPILTSDHARLTMRGRARMAVCVLLEHAAIACLSGTHCMRNSCR